MLHYLSLFLQLLGYIKDQVNEFTKKHLDFYYYDILGLTRKGPLPDEANIIIRLMDDVQAFFVTKGTRLSAGQDNLDKDLVYVTEKDTLITQAQIQQIKTLYTGKQTTTLQQVDDADKDERLMKMMQLTLGDPNTGDALPYYNGEEVTITVLQTINAHLSDANNQAYIKDKLFFLRADDFAYIINNYATPNGDWERRTNLLKAAFIHKKTPPGEVRQLMPPPIIYRQQQTACWINWCLPNGRMPMQLPMQGQAFLLRAAVAILHFALTPLEKDIPKQSALMLNILPSDWQLHRLTCCCRKVKEQ